MDSKKKRAVAYVSDIILGRTGNVICREAQKEAIRKFAEEKGIEIVEFFEDEVYNEDLIMRPGIQKMLAYDGDYELVLVDRVWALSRNWNKLQEFFAELDKRGLKLDTATTMWDAVSQLTRRRFDESLRLPKSMREKMPEDIRVKRPKRFHFAQLTHKKANA